MYDWHCACMIGIVSVSLKIPPYRALQYSISNNTTVYKENNHSIVYTLKVISRVRLKISSKFVSDYFYKILVNISTKY